MSGPGRWTVCALDLHAPVERTGRKICAGCKVVSCDGVRHESWGTAHIGDYSHGLGVGQGGGQAFKSRGMRQVRRQADFFL